LTAFALAFAVRALRSADRPAAALPRALAIAWLALSLATAISAPAPDPAGVMLDAAAALLLLALLSSRWDARAAMNALALSGVAMSAIVIVQWVGPGPRLRMFGTLGNPDFCAAWIAPSLCASLALPRRRAIAASLVQLAALACIGSFATLIALGAAALATARAWPRARLAPIAFAAIALCTAAAGRSPSRAIEGRLYLHRVALPHALDAPLLGLGPGSVRALWPGWESERWASGAERDEARPFAAAQDHLHDDWLEGAIERGLPATLILLLLAGLAIHRASTRAPAAAAGIAALAARALFDFPLARPAELTLFAVLIALTCQEE
jgi:hypothetical protein